MELLRDTIRLAPAPSSTRFCSVQRSDLAQSNRRESPKKNLSRRTFFSSVSAKSAVRPSRTRSPGHRDDLLQEPSGSGSIDGRASISTTSLSPLTRRANQAGNSV